MTVKFLERKRRGGTSGSFRRVIMNGNATAASPPMARLAMAAGSPHPCCWPLTVPNASPPTARATTSEPRESKCPVDASSRDSGTCRIVAK